MSSGAQIDYAALAKKHGGVAAPVDYAALAAKHGGTASLQITAENLRDTIVRRSQGQLSPEESEELNRFIGDPANREAVEAATTAMSNEGRQGPVARFLNAAVVDPAVGTAQLLRQNASMGVVNPFGVARDVGAGLIQAQQEAGQEFFEKTASETNPMRNVERFLEAGVPIAGPAYRSLRKKVESGDIAGAAGETALELLGARLGTRARPGPSTTGRLVERVVPRPQTSVVKEALSLPPNAIAGVEDIFRAAAPTGTKSGFRTNMYAAAGDLAEIGRTIELKKARGGIINPDMRARATRDAINDYLSKLEAAEHAPQIKRHADAPVSVKLNFDTKEGLKFIERTAGGSDDRFLAAKMGHVESLPLSEVDRLARVVNKELLSFERMTDAERAAAKLTNRRLGSLKELDKTLSKVLNEELTQRGEVGLRSFERRFAALSQIRDQLQARINAVELQRSVPMVREIRGALTGKAGIASASQAAIADVNVGRSLQEGFRKLAESGIKPNRPKPPIP